MYLYSNIYVFSLRLAGSRVLRPPENIRKGTERHGKQQEALRKERQINLKWLLRFRVDNSLIPAVWGILVPAH